MTDILLKHQHDHSDMISVMDSDDVLLEIDDIQCYVAECHIEEESSKQHLYTTREKPEDLPDGQHWEPTMYGYTVYTYTTWGYNISIEISPDQTGVSEICDPIQDIGFDRQPTFPITPLFDNGNIYFPTTRCDNFEMEVPSDEGMWVTLGLTATPEYEVESNG